MKRGPIKVRWFDEQLEKVNARLDAKVVQYRDAFTRRREELVASLTDDLAAYREYLEVLDREAELDRKNWDIGESHGYRLPSDPRRPNTPYTRKWK